MLFSIVTVCYNCISDIAKTIDSVLSQSFQDYEYVIKDGGSDDGTLDVIHRRLDNEAKAVIYSNEDLGIYYAMNEAIAHCNGDYILFMNAGDILKDSDTLAKVASVILNEAIKPDILYGNIDICSSKGKVTHKKYNKLYGTILPYLFGDTICHQATFTKRQALVERNYDTDYVICADRDWFIYAIKNRLLFDSYNAVIGEVAQDGFSRNNIQIYEKEVYNCICRYSSFWAWIYKLYIRIRYNRVIEF